MRGPSPAASTATTCFSFWTAALAWRLYISPICRSRSRPPNGRGLECLLTWRSGCSSACFATTRSTRAATPDTALRFQSPDLTAPTAETFSGPCASLSRKCRVGQLGPLGGHKVHKSGQVLYHGRDGHATKPSWHGRLAHEGLGVMRLTRYLSQPAPFALCPLAPRSM